MFPILPYMYVHPWKLTWNLKIIKLNRKIIFQTSFLGSMLVFRSVYCIHTWAVTQTLVICCIQGIILPGWNLPSYIGIINEPLKGSLWINQYNGMSLGFWALLAWIHVSKKSPTGPKPEYLISLAPYLGVRWDSVPFNFSWKVRNDQKGSWPRVFSGGTKSTASPRQAKMSKMGSPGVPLIWWSTWMDPWKWS